MMDKTGLTLTLVFLFFSLMPGQSEAALYIDDTFTTDKGHFELEYSVDYYKDIEREYDPETEEDNKIVSKETDLSIYSSCGLADNWDVGVTVPYQFLDDSSLGKISGFSDIVVESKYRLRNESKILPSFALYFDLKTDSANEDRSLGTGKKDYTLNNIFTKTIGEIVLDLNLGYIFVGGKPDDVFFYSLDLARGLTEKIGICTEIYGETTFEGNFDQNIFCAALSLDYQLNKMVCLESGVGIGISKASPDYQFSSTITFSF